MASRKEKKEDEDPLRIKVRGIAEKNGARKVAVAFHDYETRTAWSYHGDEWFHAASTIKVPVLVGVFGAIHRGDLALNARVHVRNRFISVADGSSFTVGSARDANAEVQQAIGKTMKVHELAHHMITTSSNLATNLLLEVVGIEQMQSTLKDLNLDDGVELRRGVEDEQAFEADINNRCTADGMLRVLRKIEEGRAFSKEASARMLEILHAQAFRSGIPAGLPNGARVANKTGEISTVAHDAGIVYLPRRKPYALVVLTEWDAQKTAGRSDTIASISRAVYHHLTGKADA
jgi:beta-lactamase class A